MESGCEGAFWLGEEGYVEMMYSNPPVLKGWEGSVKVTWLKLGSRV